MTRLEVPPVDVPPLEVSAFEVSVPLPDDWQVLDLDAGQRSRGALLSALLAGRDGEGVLAAALDVVVTALGRPGRSTRVAADGVAVVLARTVSPYRSVIRLDLPAGPAVGVQDVLPHPDAGQVGLAQVWLPLVDARALVLTLSTPCLDEHDGLTRLLSTVAHGLVVHPGVEAVGRRDSRDRPGQDPIERQSRARSAAT